MNPRTFPCQLLLHFVRRSATAASIVFGAPALAGGASIAVTPHEYVFEGKSYGDLESLARALPAEQSEALAFEACVPGSTGLLIAVVQRFADRPLTLSVRDVSTPACSAAPSVMSVAYRQSAASTGGFVLGSSHYPLFEAGYPAPGYTYDSSGRLIDAWNADTVSGQTERYWQNMAP